MANSTGPGVDAAGNPVSDPTRNVLDLVEAAIQRQDDLRKAEFQREDDLRTSDALHHREIADLRWRYDTELRKAETARIDAIRAVDVGAVNRAAEVATTQAQTLATQVATSAETLRAQVAAADTARRSELAAALEPIQQAIQDLRRAQYEAQGVKAQSTETGISSRVWIGLAIAAAALLSSLVVGVAGVIITIIIARGGGK